jgi:hypothetical protein
MQDSGEVSAVELDEFDADGLLLPELEDAVEGGGEVEVGAE